MRSGGAGNRIAKVIRCKQFRLLRKAIQMEKQIELNAVYTPEVLRSSSNNMMCIVTYEPLPQDLQNEIEELMAVAL